MVSVPSTEVELAETSEDGESIDEGFDFHKSEGFSMEPTDKDMAVAGPSHPYQGFDEQQEENDEQNDDSDDSHFGNNSDSSEDYPYLPNAPRNNDASDQEDESDDSLRGE